MFGTVSSLKMHKNGLVVCLLCVCLLSSEINSRSTWPFLKQVKNTTGCQHACESWSGSEEVWRADWQQWFWRGSVWGVPWRGAVSWHDWHSSKLQPRQTYWACLQGLLFWFKWHFCCRAQVIRQALPKIHPENFPPPHRHHHHHHHHHNNNNVSESSVSTEILSPLNKILPYLIFSFNLKFF